MSSVIGLVFVHSGKPGHARNLPKAAGLDDHIAAAFLADDVGHLVLNLDALALQIDLGLLERRLKAVIEVVQQLDIVQPARLDLVELVLHVRGKLVVRDRLELVHEQTGNALRRAASDAARLLSLVT